MFVPSLAVVFNVGVACLVRCVCVLGADSGRPCVRWGVAPEACVVSQHTHPGRGGGDAEGGSLAAFCVPPTYEDAHTHTRLHLPLSGGFPATYKTHCIPAKARVVQLALCHLFAQCPSCLPSVCLCLCMSGTKVLLSGGVVLRQSTASLPPSSSPASRGIARPPPAQASVLCTVHAYDETTRRYTVDGPNGLIDSVKPEDLATVFPAIATTALKREAALSGGELPAPAPAPARVQQR